MPDATTITADDFPQQDDWDGWIQLWCRDDTGSIDCVPVCLRPPIAHLVRPDGWLKHPDTVPNTPYKIARWFHFGSGLPMPPWIGMGATPDDVRRAWEDALAKLEAKREAEAALHADLYFIQSGDDGPIKIGVTGSIRARLKQLQTAHPFKLRLLHLASGEALREIEYHERFAEHRLQGEWFAPHPDILAEIERLQ